MTRTNPLSPHSGPAETGSSQITNTTERDIHVPVSLRRTHLKQQRQQLARRAEHYRLATANRSEASSHAKAQMRITAQLRRRIGPSLAAAQ
jgi:hypothetical protein